MPWTEAEVPKYFPFLDEQLPAPWVKDQAFSPKTCSGDLTVLENRPRNISILHGAANQLQTAHLTPRGHQWPLDLHMESSRPDWICGL